MRRLGVSLTSLVLAASLLTVLAAPASAASKPVPLPASPTGLAAPVKKLPRTLDRTPAYVAQSTCWPADKPGIAKVRDLVLSTYRIGGAGNASRGCQEGTSEHSEGRAWDWMVDSRKKAERAAAADFLSWLTKDDGANAKRLGVMYVIYNKRIWGVYRAKDGWRTSSGHVDHVHLSFSWDGAYARTSFWTGKALTTPDLGPCRYFTGTYAVQRSTARTGACPVTATAPVRTTRLADRAYGATGSLVRTAQGLLKVKRTGTFDAATYRAVKAFQTAHDIPLTGVLDQTTWAALSPGDVTKDALKGLTAKAAGRKARSSYADRVLREGRAIGLPVATLQAALAMPADQRSGYFGTRTKAAVVAFQRAQGLPATGVVDAATWAALPG